MTPPTTRPRVLVVSPSSFNLHSGTGVLLVNLFRGWPSDALAEIHGDPLPEDASVCRRFFRVTTDEISWAWPFSMFQRARSPERADGGVAGLTLNTGDSLLRRLLKTTVAPELPWTARLSPRLVAWIEEFRPEVLYVLPGGPYMRLAALIAERWKLPVVVHMMDDWPSAPLGGLFGGAIAARLRADLAALMARATRRFAISDAMASEYGTRHGASFDVFQNPVDVAGRRAASRTSWGASRPFRLVYIGSVLPQAQLDSLADIAAAVEGLNHAGRPARLDVFSAWSGAYPTRLRASDAVGLHPGLGEADVFDALTHADVLVLPVNFDAYSRRFIGLSMPAKIPLYLLSGTPVLVYGPAEAASVRYAATEGWGHVVSARDDAALRNAIALLMDDAALRERLGRRAVAVAEARHDAARVRAAFQDAVAGAVR